MFFHEIFSSFNNIAAIFGIQSFRDAHDDLLNFISCIIMGKKVDFNDFERSFVIGIRRHLLFQKLLIFYDFQDQLYLGFRDNIQKKNKISVSCKSTLMKEVRWKWPKWFKLIDKARVVLYNVSYAKAGIPGATSIKEHNKLWVVWWAKIFCYGILMVNTWFGADCMQTWNIALCPIFRLLMAI